MDQDLMLNYTVKKGLDLEREQNRSRKSFMYWKTQIHIHRETEPNKSFSPP